MYRVHRDWLLIRRSKILPLMSLGLKEMKIKDKKVNELKSIKDRQLIRNECKLPVTDLNLPPMSYSAYDTRSCHHIPLTNLVISNPKLRILLNHLNIYFWHISTTQKSTASPPYPSLAYFTNAEALSSDTLK